ncbi:UDP-N-acetylmuramoyl-L-alanyl-D-glutamate--2,6-diaminopimelate ligase [Leeia sp. TBRC 13508]|uniref:Multifunctional fusion protein n=1 Tax=Leeia speluncae TaxID=2884804 RepID=A0ABS8D5T5_9NEIS|nr:UDP-N-acetylmuramoyl-L-alanyl-D-glutamate--2,6-diaminopimelate ligase [Leeia speluncae]MCB6183492.1 UDP-N-acetylmuramoyl-L-alanyl-D-glutamate--2,6-diaminopimelate ligase [Leeia speluncae]
MSPDLIEQFRKLVSDVTSLTIDSREVIDGSAFFALPGEHGDGRDYIAAAIDAGATLIVWECDGFTWNPAWSVKNLPVKDLRQQIGALAASFYGKPAEKMRCIGVTGTNGKTSCTHWLMQAFDLVGKRTAVVGTVGNGFAGNLTEATHTTPMPIALQQLFSRFADAEADIVAMEVSSHALEQGRANAVPFKTALFTNLTRDHLDYHGDMQAYAAAKSKLFAWQGLETAVLNADDPFSGELSNIAEKNGSKVITYGLSVGDIHCTSIDMSIQGLNLAVATPQGGLEVNSRLIGEFNISNLLGVLGVLLAEGFSLPEAKKALEGIESVAGRMQRVGGGDQPLVVVDYAHTPDALEKALGTLKVVLPESGKLISVFGCGGDRDAGKRAVMGGISTRLADFTIITSDNPRTEAVDAILAEVQSGAEQGKYEVIADRKNAIRRAIATAKAGDIILVAGKGHEDYQIIGKTKYHFDDVEEATLALLNAPQDSMTALSYVAKVVGGALIGQDVAFNSVTHDTRLVKSGTLYIARQGATLDGHTLIPDAIAKGATAALVEKASQTYGCPVVLVENADEALGKLAAWWRSRFRIPVAAITGSCGKTTVKDMLAAVCAASVGAENVVATEGSLNNHTGLPLTLLRLRNHHQYAVIEMGMNHLGELSYLTQITRPTVALVNNAQPVHLEGVGSLDGVAKAKGEIYDGLQANGVAIINAEDKYCDYWKSLNAKRHIKTFGFANADVSVSGKCLPLESHVEIRSNLGKIEATLKQPGEHNVLNAAAVTAVAQSLGLSNESIKAGLASYQGSKGRLQQKPAKFGGRLIDDSYNANPASMKAALDVLARLDGTRIYVMGGMGELGVDSQSLHAEVGQYAVGKVNYLLAWGGDSFAAAKQFGENGYFFEDFQALLNKVATLVDKDVTVLVKGSRSMKMERVVEFLMGEA